MDFSPGNWEVFGGPAAARGEKEKKLSKKGKTKKRYAEEKGGEKARTVGRYTWAERLARLESNK